MNTFDKSMPSYHGEEPVTPYQKAAQVWDERLGTAWAQARNWRAASLVMALSNVLLLLVVLLLIDRAEVRPYVVEVTATGEVKAVAPVKQFKKPAPAQVRSFVERFATVLTSVPMDPVLMRSEWESLYHYVTESGAKQLTDYIRQHRPFDQFGSKRVSVAINNTIHLGGNSYQVQWTQESYTAVGKPLGKLELTGLFLVYEASPTSPEQLLENPLGLFVDRFEIREGREML